MAQQPCRRQGHDARPGVAGEQPTAYVGQDGRDHTGPDRGVPPPADPRQDREDEHAGHGDRHGREEVPAGGRDDGRPCAQHRDPRRSEDDLPAAALDRHRAYAARDVAGALAVPDRAVDVAEHAARQHHVEEHRAVAVGDGRPQRQRHAQAAEHETPARGAGHGGHQADRECREDRRRIDHPQTVQERGGAQPPEEHGEDARPDENPQPWPDRPRQGAHVTHAAGSARRSRCCTTTRSSPAAHASNRRRR